MDFMERIQQRIAQREQRRHSGGPESRTKTRQNIQHNRFDRQMWGEIRSNEAVDRDITDLMVGDSHHDGQREGYDNAPELLQDLTYALYKPDPKLEPKRRVEKDARLNRAIIEEVQGSPYYEELREHTVLDDTCTTIALNTMVESVRQIIARNQEAARQSNEDKANSTDEMNNEDNRPPGCFPQPAEGGEQDGPGQPGTPDDQPGEPGEPDGESDGESGESGEPSEQPGPEGDDDFDDDPELGGEHEGDGTDIDVDEDFARAVNQAVREASEEVDELEDLRRGIGLEDGTWRQMSPEERLKMAERLKTPTMRTLSDMIGRMKRFAMGQQAQKVSDVAHEPVDVTTGNDLRHLLGSEYVLLDDEDLEWEFYRRFVDGEMLQYKLQGTENAGKGPIVACIDKSYSMSGRPFTWAMGVAEALRRICQEQGRDYYAMFFGNNNDRHRFDFPKGNADFGRILEFLSCQANGGTQFEGVLEEALKRVAEQHDDGLAKADIVFITDGQAHLSEEWLKQFNEEKERVGCRVFGVYIGGANDMYGMGRGPTQVLEQFSDIVIPVSELTTDAVGDIFSQV